MKIDSENIRDGAAQKLECVEQSHAKSVGKIKPKIIICSAHKAEISVMSSCTLFRVLKIKFELIFIKSVGCGIILYNLKFDLTLREMIYKNHDKLKSEYGIYSVRNR